MFSPASFVDEQEVRSVLDQLQSVPWPPGVDEARLHYDHMGSPIAKDVRVETVDAPGVTGQMLTPPVADKDRAAIFLHGGGYVFGSLRSHGGLAAEVARAAQCAVLQLDYRRAPEHPFPAALEDSCAAFRLLVARGIEPQRIALVGDSAGGGLVVATLVALREAGDALPGAVVCLSPWVDLEATGESYETRKAIDPMVEWETVDLVSRLYLNGADPRTPTASPIHADLRGLPPLLVQVGEREILFSDAQRLADKARASGVDVIFEEWPALYHVWHLQYEILSAARVAIARVGQFVRSRTGGWNA
jgi:monoterpene epsilon-lactone hydrolase